MIRALRHCHGTAPDPPAASCVPTIGHPTAAALRNGVSPLETRCVQGQKPPKGAERVAFLAPKLGSAPAEVHQQRAQEHEPRRLLHREPELLPEAPGGLLQQRAAARRLRGAAVDRAAHRARGRLEAAGATAVVFHPSLHAAGVHAGHGAATSARLHQGLLLASRTLAKGHKESRMFGRFPCLLQDFHGFRTIYVDLRDVFPLYTSWFELERRGAEPRSRQIQHSRRSTLSIRAVAGFEPQRPSRQIEGKHG